MGGSRRAQFDCAILVALPEEFDTLISMPILGTGGRSKSGRDATAFFSYNREGRPDGEGIICLFGDIGSRARNAAQRLMESYDPELVISLGIAMKANKDVAIGDVVVATSITNLVDGGKVVDAPGGGIRLEIAGEPVLPTKMATKLLSTWWAGATDLQKTFQLEAHRRFTRLSETLSRDANAFSPPRPRLHFAHAACGPIVSASNEFAGVLQDAHRKTFSYDMESGYVGDALSEIAPDVWFLSVRGISDSGDPTKTEFENSTSGIYRTWSTQNAASFVTEFLRRNVIRRPRATKTSPRSVAAGKIRNGRSKALPDQPHISIADIEWAPGRYKWRSQYPAQVVGDASKIDISTWNSRYGPLVRSAPFLPKQLLQGIIATVQKCREAGNVESLLISGVKGTAKGTLLEIIYHLCGKKMARAFIDLREYRDLSRESETALVVDQLVTKLSNDFPRPQPLVILIDKLGEGNLANSIYSALSEEAASRPGSFLIGAMNRYGENNGPAGAAWDYFVELNSITFDNPGVDSLVRSFAATNEVIDDVLAKIHKLKHPEVDPKLISVLLKYRSTPQFSNSRTVPQLAVRFVSAVTATELRVAESLALERASEYAFRSFAQRELDRYSEKEKEVFSSALRWGDWVQRSLIAWFVVEALKSLARPGAESEIHYQALSSVYEAQISGYIKQLALQSDQEDAVFRGAKAALDRKDLTIAPVCVYLLGRLADGSLRSEAQRVLRNVLKTGEIQNWRGAEDLRRQSLVRRAIYISLAYLGDMESASEYARLLLNDEKESSLNRGFHIEYYGDRRVQPSLGINGYLLVDDGVGKWDRTKAKLAENLRGRLSQDAVDALGIVEFATFCSFVASRHSVSMSSAEQAEVCEVLDLGLNARGMPTDLCATAEFLKDHKVHVAEVIKTLYRLKHEERAGWRKRKIAVRLGHLSEAVASHVFGTLLLAYALLPDQPKGDFKYNKINVLEYILLHDLGESIVGDLAPEEKAAAPDAEEIAVRRITAYSVLPQLRKLNDLERKWGEFERRTTPDAQVARDFDLLDAWVQGYIYRPHFDSQESFKNFEEYHRSAVKTPPGRKVIELLQSELEALSQPVS